MQLLELRRVQLNVQKVLDIGACRRGDEGVSDTTDWVKVPRGVCNAARGLGAGGGPAWVWQPRGSK
jgi:hypothetical protein